ncbi:MAG: AAA family ATPase [Verrucomicrobiales bacterium]|nr:AAA family ATPase [Verrucomicrobiales bacterium]
MASGKTKNNRTNPISKLLVDSLQAGLSRDTERLELIALSATRRLKPESPDLAKELADMLASFSVNASSLRWASTNPPPTDPDEGLSLLKTPSIDQAQPPLLADSIATQFRSFIDRRKSMAKLLQEGLNPPRTILCQGPPGTGKTMSAYWLARELDIPLVVLDLATSISSYLGKTGANLRKILDYARSAPCLLLLDEFDAIAKRRDDHSDVGELKRIVNVLLKELEDWPYHSVIYAATNHQEMIDPAMERRFDLVVQMPLPAPSQRAAILRDSLGSFAANADEKLFVACAELLAGTNGSDIYRAGQSAASRHLIDGTPLAMALLEELGYFANGEIEKSEIGNVVRALRAGTNLTVREIAEFVGKSPTSVQYHLTKKEKDGGKKTKTAARKR